MLSPSIDDHFSWFDHLRPCLDSCFPCLQSIHQPNYFPDSDSRGLLEDYDRVASLELQPGHPHPLPTSSLPARFEPDSNAPRLSRWDLLLTWFSTTLSSSQSLTSNPPDDFLDTSALLPPTDQADALILDEISIALKSRSNRSRCHPTISNPNSDPHSPHPKSSQRSKGPKIHRINTSTIPPRSGPSLPPESIAHSLRSKASRDHVSPAPSNLKRWHSSSSSNSKSTSSRTPTQSRPLSSSSHTDTSLETELMSVPTLISETSATSRSSTSPSEARYPELNLAVIKYIHQTYNQQARRLFGRDLSRSQIQQIYDHLISPSRHTPTNPSTPSGLDPQVTHRPNTTSRLPTIHNRTIDPNHQDSLESIPNSDPASIELESLGWTRLSTDELLQAIKATRNRKPNDPHDSSSTIDQGDREGLPLRPSFENVNELSNFELEQETDRSDLIFLPPSFLDLISKGSRLVSQLWTNGSNETDGQPN